MLLPAAGPDPSPLSAANASATDELAGAGIASAFAIGAEAVALGTITGATA